VQLAPQGSSPAPHELTHEPFEQKSPWAQAFPQAPQFLASSRRFTQPDGHALSPATHAQAPFTQSCPGAQAILHAPQCERLLETSTHPSQSSLPLPQGRPVGIVPSSAAEQASATNAASANSREHQDAGARISGADFRTRQGMRSPRCIGTKPRIPSIEGSGFRTESAANPQGRHSGWIIALASQ
jgi:hypothetical protein